MHTRRFLVPLIALAFLVGALGVVPRAEEGFWPYNLVPKAAIKAKYKFDVTDQWLKHLQLATVHFGGATGSIVSPQGLVLTNHHVGLRSLQQLSTAEKDYVKNGFYAPTVADELKVPGLSLRVLQSIEDVSDKVAAAVTRVHDAAGDLGRPSEGHPGNPGPAPAGREPAGRVALRGRRAPPVHLQGLQRRAAGVRRRVPDRVLRRRRRQLHLSALQRRRVDVPAVRERQARRDAELPEVVAEGIGRRRADLHDRPPGLDAAPEHAGALQVPPRPGAAVLHRQHRDARSGGEEVDGAERRERPPGQDRALRHPEQPQVAARPAEGPAGPGGDGEEGGVREAAPRRTGEERRPSRRNWATRGTSSRSPSRWRARSTPNATSSRTRRA